MMLHGSAFTSRFSILEPLERLGVPAGGVVLSFDDGPEARGEVTSRILDVLKTHDTRAFFCVVGQLAEKTPEIVLRAFAEGHAIVNHTHSHPIRSSYKRFQLEEEIDRCSEVISRITGSPSPWFRPVCGMMTRAVREAIALRGLKVAPLSLFGFDTQVDEKRSDAWVKETLKALKSKKGGWIVIHEQKFTTHEEPLPRLWLPEALDKLMSGIEREGLHTVRPDQAAFSLLQRQEALKRSR